jgi:hypothetical protein
VAQVLPCCPSCGARVAARAEACAQCGCRFLEDRSRRPRVRPGALVAVVAIALAGGAAILVAGGGEEAGDPGAETAADVLAGQDELAPHPLSTDAVEELLEARFIGVRADESSAVVCSPLQPRPAHAIRHCRILYPGGGERRVVVLTNPKGRELLVDR